MRKSLVLLLMLLSGCVSFNAASIKLPAETDEPPMGFPREWDGLEHEEVKRKLEKMLGAGRLREIKELAKSPIDNPYGRQADVVSLAARCVSERLRPDQLIPLCREFEFDSPAWIAAYHEIYRCERQAAVAYIREIAAQHGAKGKFHAYHFCADWRWDDLIDMARSDMARPQEFDDTIVIANQPIASVGVYASRYLVDLGVLQGKGMRSR